jgi:CHRD domain
MRRYKMLMLMAALMLPAAGTYAKPTTFTANLTQALEIPPTGSTATGSATITLDPAANTLRVQVTFSGLTSNTVMAHIHCCLASLFANANVGVATTVPAFPGFPLGVTSGTYDHVLDLTSASSYNPAFVTAQGGTVAMAEAALINGIQNGETYLNIHTVNFPSGEIRGFLVASPTPAKLSLLKTIPINGTSASPTTKLFSFDISWVDPTPIAGHPNGLYYLADRSNAALDVIDIATETLFGQIGGNGMGQANFKGDTGTTATSGPDGVVALFPCIFAGDGDSRLLSFNGAASFTTVVTALSTGGTSRVDEMAIDPAPGQPTGLVIAANNADNPPFSTIFTYNKTTCALSNPIKTTFTALPGGHQNTNGIEQPVWEPMTQRFYVSLPEIDGPGDGTGITGAVARITTGGTIETIYPINYCQPAGLTVGPNGNLLVGCNSVFDNSGKKCTAVVPAPSPTTGTAAQMAPARPATCTGGTAYPQVAICNPGQGCTGNSLQSVFGVGGGDEVWFNSGDGNYYVTAGNNPIGPTFGVVNSSTNTLTQLVPTLPPTPLVPLVPPVGTRTTLISSGTAHSIAASAANNHVYLPLPANNDYLSLSSGTPACVQGCVAVFSAQ